jgi:cellulose synthase (UDP-forming)
MAGVGSVFAYASAGIAGWVPWRTSAESTVASGAWLALAGVVLVSGTLRIRSAEYATSRRNAHRIALRTKVTVDDIEGELVDISVGGAAVTFQRGALPSHGLVQFQLPGAAPLKMEMVTMRQRATNYELASLKLADDDWNGYRTMSLWLFHTPLDVPELPPGLPAIATTRRA